MRMYVKYFMLTVSAYLTVFLFSTSRINSQIDKICTIERTLNIPFDTVPQNVALYPAPTGDATAVPEENRSYYYAQGPFAWSPDGRYIAAQYLHYYQGVTYRHAVQVYDMLEHGFIFDSSTRPGAHVTQFVWSPNSRFLAVDERDQVYVYSLETRSVSYILDKDQNTYSRDLPTIIEEFSGYITQVIWSSDSQVLAVVTQFERRLDDYRILPSGTTLSFYDRDGELLRREQFEARVQLTYTDEQWWVIVEPIYLPALDEFTDQKVEQVFYTASLETDEKVFETQATYTDNTSDDETLLLITYEADAAPSGGTYTVWDVFGADAPLFMLQAQSGNISVMFDSTDSYLLQLTQDMQSVNNGVVTVYSLNGEKLYESSPGQIEGTYWQPTHNIPIWPQTDKIIFTVLHSEEWFNAEQLIDMSTGEVLMDNLRELAGGRTLQDYSWSPDGRQLVGGFADMVVYELTPGCYADADTADD